MIEAVNEASGRKNVQIYTDHWEESEGGKYTNNQLNRETTTNKRPNKEWWDHECETAITERKEKFKTWKRTRTMKDFQEYKRTRAYAVKIIRTKKRESYIRFVESINRQSNMKYMWNKVRILRNANSKVSWNSWSTGNRQDAIVEGINKIAPPWVESERIIIKNRRNVEDKYGFKRDFSMEELRRAIRRIKIKSAPGIDHIDNEMIKKLPNQ